MLILLPTLVWYMRKKRFDVTYSVFLSGMIGALLKYMVSDSLRFTNAPPALDVLILATLSVFNWRFWIATLIFFLGYLNNPLLGVSGLLLGFGFGRWHQIRKKRLLKQKGELKRKVWHSAMGLFSAVVIMLVPRNVGLGLCVFATLSPLLMSLPGLKSLAKETKRPNEWMGKGNFYFGLGAFLPVFLGQPWILLVLAFGDGLSTLIGKLFGYTRLYSKKSVEGTFAGFLAAWAISRHFYSPAIIPAVIYLIAELVAPLDDNFAIPVALSLLYIF